MPCVSSPQLWRLRIRGLTRIASTARVACSICFWRVAVTDAGGKAQILDYLEILAAQHFQERLESEGPGLIPPSAEQAAGEYELGTVTYNGRDLCRFGLREQEWIQHLACFGRSGAGKTNLGFLILQQLVRADKPTLVLDWKRGYRDLLALPGFEKMGVYTIGRTISPLSFNPLIPPAGTAPHTWLKKIIAVMGHAYLLGDGVAYLLQEAIDRVYEEAGVYSGSIERWPTFRDVLEALRRRQVSGRETGWMSSALRALSSLCFGEMDTLVNRGHDDIAQLLTRPVILELDALTQSDKVFVASTLLLWIHHFRMSEPVRETFKNAILIEEAHHILSGERQSLAGGQSVMEIAFREIREFGTSIILLDQMPSTISAPALANSYTVICFNLKHRADVSAISQAMLLDDREKDILGRLQIGEAVVRLQGRSARPFMIHVPEFFIHKGAVSDTDVVQHMRGLGLQFDSTTASCPAGTQIKRAASVLLPFEAQTPQSNAFAPDKVASAELALLDDVAAFPASGIAERYRRLGLSVRQGQKLKDTLVRKRLAQESVDTKRFGRVRMIRLTEQGRLLLAEVSGSPERPD